MNDIIPEGALKTLEERFGSRFVQHTVGEAGAEEPVASVFPQNAEEVETLTGLAARHSIPLVARGAGTAIYPGKPPRGPYGTFRCDAPDTDTSRRGRELGRGRAGGDLVGSRGAAAREGHGTQGLPHQRTEIHGGWLVSRKRDRGWFLRIRLAASERPLGRGRSSWRRTEHHRRQRSFETLRRVQRQHGLRS